MQLLLDRTGPVSMSDCKDGMEVHFFSTGKDIQAGLNISQENHFRFFSS
jgi:hypothetical protein